MKEITSGQNKQYKQWKKLSQKSGRDKSGLFLAEGKRLVLDALESRQVECCVVSEGTHLPEADCPVYRVSEQLFAGLAQTQASQGVLAVCRKPQQGTPSGDALLVCDGIADPGNLGTLIRTAECAGMDGVVLLPDCVDPFSPKVVRSTMGSIFRMPIYHFQTKELSDFLNYDIIVAALEDSEDLYETSFAEKVLLVIGSEARGVRPEVAALANKRVVIPMCGRAESLNAATAGAVVMYELLRRRREG